MQVSWIEPEQLRDLVGQLQTPAPAGESIAWEVHTLPESSGSGAASLEIADHDLWMPDLPPQVAEGSDPATGIVEEMFAPGPTAEIHAEQMVPHPDEPELDRIRLKLHAIRERAIQAGLLAHVQPGEPPARQEKETMPPGNRSADPESVATEAQAIAATPGVEFRQPVAAEEARPQSPFALAESASADDELQPPPFCSDVFSEPAPIETHEPLAPLPCCQPIAATSSTSSVGSHGQLSFEVPLGAITERLSAFAVWASRRLQTAEMLIVDDHGDILWGQHAHAGLVVSAMMACTAALRSSALGACELPGLIEQPITADRVLVVLPCPTQYGTINITLIHQGALPPSEAAILREALVAAVDITAAHSSEMVRFGGALD